MAGHKYGEINYTVNIDVEKQSLTQLKADLQQIGNMTTSQFKNMFPELNTKQALAELKRIKAEAEEVGKAIEQSFNPNLGVNNLTKFSQIINKMGVDKLYTDFNKLGVAGESAFRNLTTSLVTTNNQIRQSHKLLDAMALSLKNTIKWGISSSIVNTLSGSIQQAWTFTKNLDKALNDIRIVSTKSADEMERFAFQASKAAKELGASTLDYAKGALIYYQQGLDDQQTKERTDITIKMANVLGDSAQQVSDYMTAIWNNFAKGGESLEYFADVLTNLGAKTASSAEEISQGLEKFAAVAGTVGLSYEYAAAALTTITDRTRQSADIVGTALKTLFARIQGLKLGETLDDGTTLNKYSEALDKVGISIKDQSGQLKDMDKILDEMGAKWKTLDKDQQVALAQTVAGVRQYTQLISLMDNWDFFEQNVTWATESTGELNRQQDIYMESTQAHLEKLGAATERLMNAFIDKKGINSLIDGLTNIVTLFANVTEGIGGGRNALLLLGSVGAQVFSSQIANSLNTTITNLLSAKQATEDFKVAIDNLNSIKTSSIIDDKVVDKVIEYKNVLNNFADVFSDEQHKQGNEFIEIINQKLNENAQIEKTLREQMEIYGQFTTLDEASQEKLLSGEDEFDDAALTEQYQNVSGEVELLRTHLKSLDDGFAIINQDIENETVTIATVVDAVEKLNASLSNLENFKTSQTDLINEDDKNQINELSEGIKALNIDVEEYKNSWNEMDPADQALKIQDFTKKVSTYLKSIKKQGADVTNTIEKKNTEMYNTLNKEARESARKRINENNEIIDKTTAQADTFFTKLKNLGELKIFTNMAAGLGQVASAINSLINIKNIWNNDDLSTWEKMVQLVAALATAIPLLVNGFTLFTKGLGTLKTFMSSLLKAAAEKITQTVTETAATATNTAAIEGETAALAKNTAAKTANAAASKASSAAKSAESAANVAAAGETAAAMGGVETAAAATGTAATGATGGVASLGAAIGGMILPILGVVAALAALGVAIYFIVKAYNKDKEEAEEAAKAVEELSKRYEDCKKSAEELKKTISDYRDAKKELKDLKKGTEEYKEALDKANEKAKELIETYGLYKDYKWVDGQIQIDDEVLNNLQAKADDLTRSNESALATAKIYANQTSLKSQTTNLRRDIGSVVGTGQYDENGREYKRQFSNDELTSVVNALNGMENIVESDTAAIKERLLADASVPQAVKDNLDQLFDENGKLIEGLDNLRKSSEKAAEANEYYSKQIMSNIVDEKYGEKINELASVTTKEKDENGNYKKVVNADRANQINAIATEWATSDTNKMNKELEGIDVSGVTSNRKLRKYLKEQGADFGNIGNDEDLAMAYAEQFYGVKKEDLTYEGGNNIGSIRDKDGKLIFEKVSDDVMRKELAKKAASDKITNKYSDKLDQDSLLDNVGSIMDKGAEAGAKYGTDFTDALLNAATSEDHKIDLSGLFSEIDPEEMENILGQSDEELLAMFNMSPEELKVLGYESSTDFANAFREGFTNYKWDLNKAIQSSVGEREDELATHKMDTEELSDYAKHLSIVSRDSKELADSLKYDSDAAVVVAQSVMRMNRGVESLDKNFKEWNDVMKKSSKSSKEYADAINGMRSSVADVLDVEEDAVSNDFLEKHLDDIKKAANGNEKAIDALRDAYADDLLLNIGVNNELDNATQKDLQGRLDKLQNQFSDIKIGTKLDSGKFLEEAQNIVDIAGMTEEQANAFFDSIGFDAELETEEKEIDAKKPVTKTVTENTTEVKKYDDGTEVVLPATRTWSYNDGYTPVKETVSVVAMGTDGKRPKIKSLTKKATGSMNNASSTNKGGGTSKKSGGGGGSSKRKEEKIKNEVDRYHKVNTQIAKVGKQLDALRKEEERTLDPNLLINFGKQWEHLNTQVANYTEKLKIAQGEYNELNDKLTKQGVTFNEDGTVANYFEILKIKEKEINAEIEKFNKMSAKEQEKYQKTLDKKKEEFEQFKTDLDRIDEMASDFIPEIKENIRNAIDEKIEIAVKDFDIKVNLSTDIKDLTIQVNDFINKTIDRLNDNDVFGNFMLNQKNMSALLDGSSGNLTGNVVDLIDYLAKAQEQFDSMGDEATIYGDNSSKAFEHNQEALEKLIEGYSQWVDYEKQQLELIRNQNELINTTVDDIIDKYDKIGEQIEHDKKYLQLVYGEGAASKLNKLYDLQVKNRRKQLEEIKAARDASKQNLDAQNALLEPIKAQLESLEEQGLTETDLYKQTRSHYYDLEQARQEAFNRTEELTEQLKANLETSIDEINEKMLNAIDTAIEALNNGLTESGFGLDFAKRQWELIGEEAEIYVDTINRLQGENNIESKYLKSIEEATNPRNQKKLKDIMDAEMKALREKDKLTQYDLDRAEKKYQIALAQIALEEAQQNKNKMRLRRDSQGNYRYQYVADEDNIKKAEEELTALYTDLYNFDKARFLEVNGTILDIEENTQNQIREIYADTTKSKEEKDAEAAMVVESYNNQILAWQQELAAAELNVNESAFLDLEALYGADSEKYAEACADKAKTMAELIPQFESEGHAIATNTELAAANEEAFEKAQEAANAAVQEIQHNLDLLNNSLEDLENAIDEDIDTISEAIDEETQKVITYREELAKMNETFANNEELIKSLNAEKDIIALVAAEYEKLKNAKQEIIDQHDQQVEENGGEPIYTVGNDEYDKAVEEGINGAYDPTDVDTNTGGDTSTTTTTTNNKTITDKIPRSTKLSKSEKKKLQQFLKDMGWYTDKIDGAWGKNSKNALKKFQKKVGTSQDGSWGPKTYDAAKAKGYDTGGYTGTWGNDGRLAFLHQKELVLNAQDTENILNTVAIMRNLMASMNQDILSRLARVSAGTVTSLTGGNAGLEQNVHIDANFPNATNSNEIEEALKNLVNVASQRITK